MKISLRLCLVPLFLIAICCPLFAGDVRIGLVSYWPFETVNGNTTPDLAFGNHLVLNNMTVANIDPNGARSNAFSFNGSTQFLGMAHTNNATLTNNLGLPIYSLKRYTVMFWAKGAAGQNNKVVFSEGTSNTASGLFLIGTRNGTTGTPAGGLNASIRTAGGTTILPNTLSAAPAFDGLWRQITWVDDAGTVKVYIDGVLDLAAYNYTQSSIAFNTIAVGALIRTNVGNFFAGSIDEVALWERTLSKSEIDEVRTNGLVTPIPVFAPTITTQPASPTNHVGDWVFLS
ncbi:MAG: Laminin domain protein, partial [Verrucomicrobiales bacterium]|nr:Laminin domain protein [Verrucomicrobiales bacterium]